MVAGFDDIPEARRAIHTSLTTVRQPIDRMVEETLAMLHLDDPERPIERGIDRPIQGAADLARDNAGFRMARPAAAVDDTSTRDREAAVAPPRLFGGLARRRLDSRN